LPQSLLRVAVRAVILTTLALTVACGSKGENPRPAPQDGWWRDRVFYEVFVRSFADSDGDGKGDLTGLTQKLDALNDGDPATTTDLGVEAIWLMPIMTSPSYHGYDVTNYTEVDPEYGTLADFDAFIAAAHQRGIKVILDFVLNHSSQQHPWFVDSVTNGAKRDWYSWSATNPGWTRPWDGGTTWYQKSPGGPWYYAVFWSGMPDLKLDNPEVEDAIVAAMQFWLDRGVDGFRLDAARYLVETGPGQGQADSPATHAFLKRLRSRLEARHPDVFLVGEVWTALERVVQYRGAGDELHAAFGFDTAGSLVSGLRDSASGNLSSMLGRSNAALAGADLGFQAPFLTNHDQVRIAREVSGDAAALRLAAAFLLAQPGSPFLYYGEELGMQGGGGGADEAKRTPMRWDAALPNLGFSSGTPWYVANEADGVDVASQRADEGSLWHLYRRLIAQRKAHPALVEGDLALPSASGGGNGLLAFVRSLGGKRVLFVANLASSATGPFTLNVQGAPSVLLAEGLPSLPSPAAGALAFGDLSARGWAYLTLE